MKKSTGVYYHSIRPRCCPLNAPFERGVKDDSELDFLLGCYGKQAYLQGWVPEVVLVEGSFGLLPPTSTASCDWPGLRLRCGSTRVEYRQAKTISTLTPNGQNPYCCPLITKWHIRVRGSRFYFCSRGKQHYSPWIAGMVGGA